MRPALRQNRLGMALPILIFSIAVSATGEAPKIYKWVDSNGISHYTTDPERIPKALRNRIQSINRGTPETAPVATPTTDPVATPTTATAPEEIASPSPAEPRTDPQPPSTTPVAQTAPAETEPAPIPSPLGDPDVAEAIPDPEPAVESIAGPTVQPVVRTPIASSARGDDWLERDAVPRLESLAFLSTGEATPAQLEALAAEQRAVDSRIAEVEGEILTDETFLKGLISSPGLNEDVPLFDQPAFLEVSKRLPELHARLRELRDERAKLELP